MKKMFLTFSVLFFACLLGMSFLLPISSASNDGANGSANEKLKYEKAIVDPDGSLDVPDGYRRVPINFTEKSEAKAKDQWLQAYGNMEGYSLEKAKKITFIAKNGTAPCACSMSGACYVYYPKTRQSAEHCEPDCNTVCLTGMACKKPEENLDKALSLSYDPKKYLNQTNNNVE